MSEKSILRRRIGRPLLAARPALADDADRFAIGSTLSCSRDEPMGLRGLFTRL